MEIDDKLKAAIRQASDELGSQADLAKKAGIAPAMITKYLSGINIRIEKKTADRLMPILQPYLGAGGGITARIRSQTTSDRLADLGINDATPSIVLAAIKRIASMSEDECWELCAAITQIEQRRKSNLYPIGEGSPVVRCAESTGDKK